jgi:hypothetical protein
VLEIKVSNRVGGVAKHLELDHYELHLFKTMPGGGAITVTEHRLASSVSLHGMLWRLPDGVITTIHHCRYLAVECFTLFNNGMFVTEIRRVQLQKGRMLLWRMALAVKATMALRRMPLTMALGLKGRMALGVNARMALTRMPLALGLKGRMALGVKARMALALGLKGRMPLGLN